jgi:hypothetical protein
MVGCKKKETSPMSIYEEIQRQLHEMKKRTLENVRVGKALVRHMEVYMDGSGAPATVSYDGSIFAFDTHGDEIKMHLISKRKPSKKTIGMAKHAYLVVRNRVTDDEWIKLSKEMYADD